MSFCDLSDIECTPASPLRQCPVAESGASARPSCTSWPSATTPSPPWRGPLASGAAGFASGRRRIESCVNRRGRNALSVSVGEGGSPTYTQNAHRKQRPVTWRGQGQAQSPTCSIRRSTCRSSSVQNRWPTSPDDSRQRCCGATSKCWNPLAYPAIQFRHITGTNFHLWDCAQDVGIRAGRGNGGTLWLLNVNSERTPQRKEWLPKWDAQRVF